MKLSDIFCGPSVSVNQVLHNKTLRAERQRMALSTQPACVLSFSLNIPGNIKQFPLAQAAFQAGLVEIHSLFSENQILEESLLPYAATGSEGILSLSLPPEQVKEFTIQLEDLHPLGRLWDIDVLDGCSGHALSRKELGHPPRTCYLCGQDAKVCGRSQAHELSALQREVARILNDYFRELYADKCASCATRALIYEVSVTPKPGLVDRANNGSHQDMDFFTFIDSSFALFSSFKEMYRIGWEMGYSDALFSRLRHIGKQAEQAMYAATNNVNTHKGAIFSFGLFCGSLGAVQSGLVQPVQLDRVLELCKKMARDSFRDFDTQDHLFETNGLHCYHTYNITGVRGEAAHGFPIATQVGLPALRFWLEKGACLNDASSLALLSLLAATTDTNMIHRGGIETAQRSRESAATLLKKTNLENFRSLIGALDRQYIEAGLSPGGCADLLALCLMILFLEQEGLLS